MTSEINFHELSCLVLDGVLPFVVISSHHGGAAYPDLPLTRSNAGGQKFCAKLVFSK
jgi:hypothetical protein